MSASNPAPETLTLVDTHSGTVSPDLATALFASVPAIREQLAQPPIREQLGSDDLTVPEWPAQTVSVNLGNCQFSVTADIGVVRPTSRALRRAIREQLGARKVGFPYLRFRTRFYFPRYEASGERALDGHGNPAFDSVLLDSHGWPLDWREQPQRGRAAPIERWTLVPNRGSQFSEARTHLAYKSNGALIAVPLALLNVPE